MKDKSISLPAAPVVCGRHVRSCVNLVADYPGAPLTLAPAVNAPDDSPYGGGAAYEGATADYPPLLFSVADEGVMSELVGAFHSSGDINSDLPLGEQGLASYSRMLLSAYTSLCSRAVAAGLMVQPVIVRYRLTASDGRTLHLSPPAVLALPSGWQCAGAFTTGAVRDSGGDSFTVNQLNISASAYSAQVCVPSFAAYPEVRLVEIEMSPMLHPVDYSASAAVRVSRQQSADPVVTVALPGATAAMAPLDSVRSVRLETVAGVFDSLGRMVVRVAASDHEQTVSLTPYHLGSPSADQSAMDKAVAAQAVPDRSHAAAVMRRCMAPHSFRAAVAASSGDTTVCAGITPKLWGGSHPSELLVAGEGEALCRVTVRSANGVIAIREGSARVSADLPPAMVPFVAYPDGDAVEMAIVADRGGELFSIVIPLRPSASLGMAVNASPGLVLRVLDEGGKWDDGLAVVDETATGVMLACRTSHAGIVPVACTELAAPVRALVAADRTPSSWDSSRCHLYGLTDDGIVGITADTAGGRCAATALHAGRPSAVVASPVGIFLGIGRGLWRLASSSLAPVAVAGGDISALDYDEASRRLVMQTVDGELSVVGVTSPAEVTLLRADDPDYVEWSAVYVAQPGERLSGFSVDMLAAEFSGRVSVVGAGPGGDELLAAVDVDAAVTMPVSLWRIEAPWRSRLTVRVAGHAPGGIAIHSATIMVAAR